MSLEQALADNTPAVINLINVLNNSAVVLAQEATTPAPAPQPAPIPARGPRTPPAPQPAQREEPTKQAVTIEVLAKAFGALVSKKGRDEGVRILRQLGLITKDRYEEIVSTKASLKSSERLSALNPADYEDAFETIGAAS